MQGCELYYEVNIVGLYLCLVSCTVAYDRATLLTLMDYYIATFTVRLCSYRTENTLTFVLSVAGIYIYMERAEAKRTMVS